jgi:hypothetical protein
MEKRTVVDQVEIKRDGTMQIRFKKQLVDDDGTVTELGYHRTAAMPGEDLTAQLENVDNHLRTGLKAGGLDQAEKDFCEQVKTAMWTPEVVAAKRAQLAEAALKGPGGRPVPPVIENPVAPVDEPQ